MTRNVKDSIMPSVCNCIGKSVFVLWLCMCKENGSKAVLVCELCVFVIHVMETNKNSTYYSELQYCRFSELGKGPLAAYSLVTDFNSQFQV